MPAELAHLVPRVDWHASSSLADDHGDRKEPTPQNSFQPKGDLSSSLIPAPNPLPCRPDGLVTPPVPDSHWMPHRFPDMKERHLLDDICLNDIFSLAWSPISPSRSHLRGFHN